MVAVAEFWSSRALYNSARHRFVLLDVTSPEEDYTDVNNEIYANEVAHQSLSVAIKAARLPGVTPADRWPEVADGLYLPAAGEDGEYFDFDPPTAHDRTTSWMGTRWCW